MDPELDRMLTPVKVNPEDSAAREALATYLDENSLHHDSEANRTHLRGTAPVVFHRHSESGRVMVSPKAMRANYSGPGGATIIQNAGAHVDVLHRGPIPAGARPTWVAHMETPSTRCSAPRYPACLSGRGTSPLPATPNSPASRDRPNL